MVNKEKYLVFLVAYSHIDSEWLWSLSETIIVCGNTLRKVLELMRNNPLLVYMQGGTLCLDLLEEKNRGVISAVREKISEGRWEIAGTYLEFDAYMSSGESIIRQVLQGVNQANEYGLEPQVLYLPDSFGFPNTLPKLMKGSGLKYFATHKLGWNDTNDFPYHLFKWRSDDGSTVLAYIAPGGYNDYLSSAKRVLWNIHVQTLKQSIPIILQVYGRGDHGGGPDEDELINIVNWVKHYKPLILLIPARMTEFFKYIEATIASNLPVYDGELYLEFHRGIYTTGVLAKKLNRFNESLVTQVEKLYSILHAQYSSKYPKSELKKIWKKILLNQGHDSLPATVPINVYEEIVARGFTAFQELLKLTRQGLIDTLKLNKGKYIVFNPNNWSTSTYITVKERTLEGRYQPLSDGSTLVYLKNLPPMGFKIMSSLRDLPEDETSINELEKYFILENKYLRVVLSKNSGWILRIYDKQHGRQVLSGPVRLRLLWDQPLTLRGRTTLAAMFDAWEVFYSDGLNKYLWKDLKALGYEVRGRGPLYASVSFKYRIKQVFHGESILELEVGVYADKPFVELRFNTHWRALNRLIKLIIPLNVKTEEALFEAPYGVVRRVDSCRSSNPIDRAKYEVPGGRWVDVSSGDYGVAVITDSRYGFSWWNGSIGVSLLRAPLQPLKQLIMKSMEEYVKIQKDLKDTGFSYAGKFKKYSVWIAFLVLITLIKLLSLRKLQPIDHGYHSTRIWIYPHIGDYVEGKVTNVASELNTHYIVVRSSSGLHEENLSFITVEPSDKVQVTALKTCEIEDDCLVMRLHNVSPVNVEARLALSFNVVKAFKATHLEKPVRELEIKRRRELNIVMSPMSVETILLKLPRGNPY
jgi:alpha-mannosidase